MEKDSRPDESSADAEPKRDLTSSTAEMYASLKMKPGDTVHEMYRKAKQVNEEQLRLQAEETRSAATKRTVVGSEPLEKRRRRSDEHGDDRGKDRAGKGSGERKGADKGKTATVITPSRMPSSLA